MCSNERRSSSLVKRMLSPMSSRPVHARSRCAGFTLIELLVVILIICILVAALMPIWGKITLQARRADTQARISGLTTALEKYRVQFDSYPPNPTGGFEDDGSLFIYLCGKD